MELESIAVGWWGAIQVVHGADLDGYQLGTSAHLVVRF